MPSYSWLVSLLCFALSLPSNVKASPLDVLLISGHTRTAAAANTRAEIIRRLSTTPSLGGRTYRTNSTQLEHSWQDVPLFDRGAEAQDETVSAKASVNVSCKTCYIKGRAFAELNIESDLGISQIVENTRNDFETHISNLTNNTKTQIGKFIKETFSTTPGFVSYLNRTSDNFQDGIDVADFLPPNTNISYELDITGIPETTLSFRFEDLDLYLELETILNASATHILPLFHPATPVGFSLPEGIQIGATFTVDLILEVEGSLDMTSGFHVKIDDQASLDIALFGDEVSWIDFKGGKFEFLPVTVQNTEANFTATLRVGAHVGLSMGKAWNFGEDILNIDAHDRERFENYYAKLNNLNDALVPDVDGLTEVLNYKIGGGIQVGVYADVASFRTGLKASTSDEAECEMEVFQEYSFALAATAGAQVTIGSATYGPTNGTTMNVFTTTMASICARQPPAITAAPVMTTNALQKRQASDDFSTTTAETTMDASAFGTNANILTPTTGSPTSYTAEPTTDGLIDRVVDNVQNHKRVAIGVGVGVGFGVPLLAVLAVTIFFCVRRK